MQAGVQIPYSSKENPSILDYILTNIKKEIDEPEEPEKSPVVPPTGDDSDALIYALILAASGAALVKTYRKKSK